MEKDNILVKTKGRGGGGGWSEQRRGGGGEEGTPAICQHETI